MSDIDRIQYEADLCFRKGRKLEMERQELERRLQENIRKSCEVVLHSIEVEDLLNQEMIY